MTDIRFQSFEDGELADIWYALGGAATRHPDHFKPLMDSVATELFDRRGVGLNPWLEARYREFRLTDSREDAQANLAASPEARPRGDDRVVAANMDLPGMDPDEGEE